MCGIVGFARDTWPHLDKTVLKRMGQVMAHRGPDAHGEYLDEYIALAHARLSIIDLSTMGNQPMFSLDERFVIVFNGEIYNFRELKRDIEKRGYTFKTKTDTEVILALFQSDGEDCLEKLNGMFAFAVWDKLEKKLFLARDRIGKKPLYYYFDGQNMAFASEIKSLLQIPTIKKEIDPTSIADYLKYLYIPHPKSIYKNIFKLEPGHYLVFKDKELKIRQYWDIDFSNPLKGSEKEISHELFTIISGCVKERLVSDVPIGAFLSGGVDSSAVVSLMSTIEQKPVKTCTIGFEEEKHDEAVFARNFANQYKTEHHEYYVKEDVEKVVKKLVWHCDEPFADSSMVPTYHVSRIAKKNVTVALSGDGGDESFAGYEKYSIDQIENRIRRFIPNFLLAPIRNLSRGYEQGYGRKVFSLMDTAMSSPLEGFYTTNTFISDGLLKEILSDRLNKEIEGYSPLEHTARYYNKANGLDHVSKILYTDLKSYLPGDILTKVDRMSMANSLEVRSPLLDHKVVEFAAKIPSALKINGGNKKIILKKTFERILTSELMNRKKRGFDVPLDNWFRKDLKELSHTYLFQKKYLSEFFKIPQVKILWDQHQAGRANYGTSLWSLFVFSLWYEEFEVN